MSSLIKDQILQAPIEKIGKTFLEELFAAYHDNISNENKQSAFNPTEEFTLTHEEYPYVQGKVDTTAGMLFFNRYVLERTHIIEVLGYWNQVIDRDGLESLTAEVNNLALLDKITMEQLGQYIDSRDRLGFWSAAFLSVALSPGLVRPMENVEKRKRELFEQYKEQLNSNNPVTQTLYNNKIEKELMGMVRDNLKNDPGYDLYRSGDGNLNNNYKTINVMRGTVFNNMTKRYDVVEASLMNGIDKKDITPFANSVLAAAYPSAVGTAEAGYMSKIILALLQSERIDPNPNSDCGTESTIPFTVRKKNKKYLLFRYINDNGKRVLTDLHNIDNYIGKTVQLYSPQCCKQNAICAKCAGQVFHNLGVTNIGLLTTQITQKLLNLKLKSKHDLSQNAGIVPEEMVFLHKNNFYSVNEGMLVNKYKMKLFIPRLMEELGNFVREVDNIECMGILPVKFYDKNDKEVLSTRMMVPVMVTFNIYNEIQEDIDNYIVTYEPNSEICSLAMQKTYVNCEFFINQVYLYSKSPQIPYKLLTEMMFTCLELNGTDLTGPSITYELLARRVCRMKGHDEKSFAYAYGNDPNIDQLSYEKLAFREAVHKAGILNAVLFQDISKGMTTGLAQTLNGRKPTETPLEKIIKA